MATFFVDREPSTSRASPSLCSENVTRDSSSSPETSPSSKRRPMTAMGLPCRQSYSSNDFRPSTAIGWEGKRSTASKAQTCRRFSTGTTKRDHVDCPEYPSRDWCSGKMEGSPSSKTPTGSGCVVSSLVW